MMFNRTEEKCDSNLTDGLMIAIRNRYFSRLRILELRRAANSKELINRLTRRGLGALKMINVQSEILCTEA